MATISETDAFERQQQGARTRIGIRMIGVGLGIALAAVLAVYFVVSFANNEHARDVRSWQSRLSIVADGRLQAVDGWLAQQAAHVRELANNTALKLYMSELALAGGDPSDVTDEPAQRGYLRNLLIASADRMGFAGPVLGPDVDANVERIGIAGIALIDNNGGVLAATPAMPPVDDRVREAIAAVRTNDGTLIDIFEGPSGAPSMGFIAPIFMIQGGAAESARIGFVVGIKLVADELFPLLAQPGFSSESAEAVLVRRADAAIEYLSPLADGTAPLGLRLAADTPDLAAALALNQPGAFAEQRDYRDQLVLVSARAVTRAPWALLYKIHRDEALAESDARRIRLIAILLLLVGLAGAAVVALWFRANARHDHGSAREFRTLAGRFERQQTLLRLVTDNQPTEIGIVGGGDRYQFANGRVAETAGMASAEEVLGKTIAAIHGPIEARRIQTFNRKAIGSGTIQSDLAAIEDGEARRWIQSEHIPLPDALDMPESVLVVTTDITELVTEREKRERIMVDLVDTLVAMVDRRDRFAAHHSRRTASVARAIAVQMGLDSIALDTVRVAGSVMNLGKLYVSESLLTADRRLSRDERTSIRNSILLSADIVADVEFDGPVVETLREMLEFVDGSGIPYGLDGNKILITARVCSVANAFVGLVSTRSYRPGMDLSRTNATSAFGRSPEVVPCWGS
jgi:PAS domain S-box-containing protein